MLPKIKSKFNDQTCRQGGKGQSLVEMAIISPLLLLLFIGVLEVGWAIRGYIVLVNADREATRFAARGQYLDFRQTERADIGYDYVAAHTLTSISQQLDFDVTSEDPNATLIISHYVVDTGKPCADPPCNDDCKADKHNKDGGCDCSTPERREPDYPYDDLILHPGMSGYEHFSALYGITRTSQLNHSQIVAQLKEQNDAFNCALNLKDPSVPWVPNSVVAVEAFYAQPQLLGVPLVSNYLTDPIPMYAHTVMRITAGRGSDGGESSGVGCELLPIIVYTETLAALTPITPVLNIRQGTDAGDFGWLRWTDDAEDYGSTNNEGYLAEELFNPRRSINDYREPQVKDPDDRVIDRGDWVWALTGNVNSEGVARTELERIKNEDKIYIIPVWDEAEGTGSNVMYRMAGFALVDLIGYDLGGNPKTISAMFHGWANEVCPGNGH